MTDPEFSPYSAAPFFGRIGINMEYDVVMIVQYGKSADVDSEDIGQLFHTAHAARNTVIVGGFF